MKVALSINLGPSRSKLIPGIPRNGMKFVTRRIKSGYCLLSFLEESQNYQYRLHSYFPGDKTSITRRPCQTFPCFDRFPDIELSSCEDDRVGKQVCFQN